MVVELSGYCSYCGRRVMMQRYVINHLLHLIATVFTGGLWAIAWIVLSLFNCLEKWKCSRCGSVIKTDFLGNPKYE